MVHTPVKGFLCNQLPAVALIAPTNCGDYRLSRARSPATAVMLQASTRWFNQHALKVDQFPAGIEYLHPNPEIHPPLKEVITQK